MLEECAQVLSGVHQCTRVQPGAVGFSRVPSLFVFSRRVPTMLTVRVLQLWRCRFLDTMATFPSTTIVKQSFVGLRCNEHKQILNTPPQLEAVRKTNKSLSHVLRILDHWASLVSLNKHIHDLVNVRSQCVPWTANSHT